MTRFVGTHMSSQTVTDADWDGQWPMVDAGGMITHIADSGDIEALNLVPVYWDSAAAELRLDADARDGNDCAAAFAERDAVGGGDDEV